jgi:hypothetical protein
MLYSKHCIRETIVALTKLDFGFLTGFFALALFTSGCNSDSINANRLLGKSIRECNSLFGKSGQVRFTILQDSQRRIFTGRVAPLSMVRRNYLIWPKQEWMPFCEVSKGIVVDCFEESDMSGTRLLENSKEKIGLRKSDIISSIDHVTLAALATSDVAGIEQAKSTNIVNPESFSGLINYLASYSRYLYTTAIRDGVVDSVEVTDIGEYGETAE